MRGASKRTVVLVCFLVLLLVFLASYLAGRTGWMEGSAFAISQHKVAVVYVEGVLDDSTAFFEAFDKYKDREDVKAIVIRIESPGGTIVPAQEIFEEIRKLRGKKTVLASLGNVAASGGYYVASAAEEIVANPGSLTGSIGVLSVFQNYQELMKKIGFRTSIMKSGRYKDLGNPMREMTDAEAALEQDLLENIHEQFIRDVALGRNKEVEAIRPVADGRAFTGEQAMEAGLVDRLGNLQDTIDRAAELSGIEGKPTVIYPEEERPNLWKFVFQGCLKWFEAEVHKVLAPVRPVSVLPLFLQ
jgi:protease IV